MLLRCDSQGGGLKRPPNKRGEGPAYNAAALVQIGISLEDAAKIEGVHPNSVIRVLRGPRTA